MLHSFDPPIAKNIISSNNYPITDGGVRICKYIGNSLEELRSMIKLIMLDDDTIVMAEGYENRYMDVGDGTFVAYVGIISNAK